MIDFVTERYMGVVTLVVPDYDEAIDWYVNVLGFQLIEDTTISAEKRRVVVSPGSGCNVLLAKATTKSQHASIGNQAGGRVSHFLYTNDFWLDFEKLKPNGALFEEAPRHEPYGLVDVFCDKFGNRWDLIQQH